MTIQKTFELAVENHKAGRLREAEQAYRQILAQQPDHADALNLLGVIASQFGRHEMAVNLIRKAVELTPDCPGYHCNLGNALKHFGQLDEAIAALRTAIQLNPRLADAHNNLGNALQDAGELDQAIASFRTAIELDPRLAKAHYNLGNALKDQCHMYEAVAAYQRAIELNPRLAEAHNNLANALKGLGQMDQAIASFRTAIQLKPDFAEAHSNLANTLKDLGQLDEAIAAYRTAIQLNPRLAEAYNNLANALKDAGEWDQAIDIYRTAMELKPDDPQAQSNLILSMHYQSSVDASEIAEEERRWNLRHAEPLKRLIQPHGNDRTPDRRLRVGYVSPDFFRTSIGRFMLPLLENHDHTAVEVFCYSDHLRSDEMTEQLRRHADHWIESRGLTEQQMADTVRQDRIDILVDLAMHASGNRLSVFARKPAPVQVTWLAYPGSTGLTAIDYRLTDPQLDPTGLDDAWYSEKSVRLPHTFWCYGSPPDLPQVNELAALSTEQITFGCLNNFAKVKEVMLSAWCRLLREVPNSRLLLHAKEGRHRQKVRDILAREGIDPARLEFIGRLPVSEYFQCYHRIDIALDTFPFCGGTTSCDALWMGVPVVSLVGKTTVSRGGLTILTNVGLAELAANTVDDYVKIAKELAGDLPKLAVLRAGLRQRMAQSPLMDAPRFAQDIEAAFRDMWRRWCDAQRR